MNRVFFWMIAIALIVATVRQATWSPDTTEPSPQAEQLELPEEFLGVEGALQTLTDRVDSHDGRLDGLEKKVYGRPLPDEPIKAVEQAIFKYSASAVDLAISLIGVMAFFLGLMKVAEDAGLLKVIAKVIRPLMTRLFPDVPPDHPAMGAMIMNMSANALGLGNAATPFGIKAMEELDKLNQEKGTATNAMALFLAINTSAVTLLPLGAMGLRDRLGSEDAAGIVGTTLLATLFSTAAGITAAKVLQRFWPAPEVKTKAEDEPVESVETDPGYPLWVSLSAIGLLVAAVPASLIWGEIVSPWLIPGLVLVLFGVGHARGVAVYESFVNGAKEGFQVAVRIIPYLVGILVAVGMLRASGAIEGFTSVVGQVTSMFGLPAEVLPMALLRPLSGSGAYGVMTSIMMEQGPDSYAGYLVSTLQGSTETTFYVIAVYFGAVSVSRYRHTLAAALTADVCGVIGAIIAVQLYFRLNGIPF